ncbi:hypothetical protein AVEN_187936-1 [Araneus ventricosus]|uniref:Uncharacterized protein n=1 Tax=Araneus ventricosus TaxID=182803 RepID=A0A4Y2E237_ARAVE|nr:hypothetical protein AVEN_187936-1 [Araneus ventricosus]
MPNFPFHIKSSKHTKTSYILRTESDVNEYQLLLLSIAVHLPEDIGAFSRTTEWKYCSSEKEKNSAAEHIRIRLCMFLLPAATHSFISCRAGSTRFGM